MSKDYYVYIMTNRSGTLYVGVTNDLKRRVYEHKNKLVPGFTTKYNIDKLVYFEQTQNIEFAIGREKQLKNWHRDWKLGLIKKQNPNFRNLSEDL